MQGNSGSDTILFIILTVFVVVAIIKIWKTIAHSKHVSSKENTKKMIEKIAKEQNFSFCKETNDNIVLQKHFKHLESLGSDISCEFCINGDVEIKGEKSPFSFGIYNFTLEETVSTGSSRSKFKPISIKRETYTQFYCLSCPALNLPKFYMRDENAVLDTVIKKITGMQDINFEPDDKYSSAFILQGEVEKEVRDLFQPEIRNAFLELAGKGYSIDANNDALVVYGNIQTEEEFAYLHKTMQSIVEKLIKAQA